MYVCLKCFGVNVIFLARIKREGWNFLPPLPSIWSKIKYKTSIAVGLLLSSFLAAFTFYNIFLRPLQKIYGWNFLLKFSSLCTIIRYKISMVVWMLFSCFSFYNFQRQKPFFLSFHDFLKSFCIFSLFSLLGQQIICFITHFVRLSIL